MLDACEKGKQLSLAFPYKICEKNGIYDEKVEREPVLEKR
jgi:hypothetical protein